MLLLFLFTSIVSALAHGLDVPKQIILSDHCFGFKLVHNFTDRMPFLATNPRFVLGELLSSMVPQAADLVKIQKTLP